VFEIDWSGPAGLVLVIAVVVAITGLVCAVLLVKLVKKHKQVNQPDTPFAAKFVYYASLVYAIFPIDLLPDPALIDDIGVLVGSLLYVSRVVKKVRDRRPKHALMDVSGTDQGVSAGRAVSAGRPISGGRTVSENSEGVSGGEADPEGRAVSRTGQGVSEGQADPEGRPVSGTGQAGSRVKRP
jgi:uncharacterized membrane protein YkvA (DUF1232 family)